MTHPPLRQAEWRCSSGEWRVAPLDAVEDIASSAAHRFTVVRDLMDSLSSLPLKDISDCDLTHITRSVHLLTREGCAVLEVIQWRAAQEN